MLPKNVEDIYPLTPMQHLMLLHSIQAGGNSVLFSQISYEIRGPLDAEAFRGAWQALVARHGALRTAFLWEGLAQPLQVVRTAVTLPYRSVDLSELSAEQRAGAIESLRREDAEAPLTLGRAPLMRCTLVRLGSERHLFLWAVHHLVIDRWSHAVLFSDLRTLYAAGAHGTECDLGAAAQFRDYVHWIARQDRETAEQFWRGELAGLHTPTLLAGERAAHGMVRRVTTPQRLSVETTAAVQTTAARWRTTPAGVLLAAIGLLVAARSGDDVMFGVTVSGRPPELEDAAAAVGSFVNNLPARLIVQRERRIDEWVRDVQRAQVRRQAFAHVALSDIHEWSDVTSAYPLFDTLVVLNLTDESGIAWPDIELVADSATMDAAYPLVLSVSTADGRLLLSLVHDESFAGAAALLAELGALIARIATATDGTTVGDLVPAATDGRRVSGPASASPKRARGAAASETRAEPSDGAVASTTAAAALLRAWREVLGIEDVDLDDDFFALGGTSLQAAQLFARVERIAGKTLPLSTLFGAGSVRALLAEIDCPLPRNGSLVRIRSSGEREPLYAIPGIGGNVVGLAPLARQLGADRPFGAFESPGLDGREAPLASIEAIAGRYVEELLHEDQQDFHLLGICWGAAVAFEMARRLSAAGRSPTSLVLLDPAVLLRDTAAHAPRAEAAFLRNRFELYWDEFRDGDWRDRTRMLTSKARRAAKLLAGGDTLAQTQGQLQHLRVRTANMHAVSRYVPGRFEGRARIFLTAGRDFGAGEDPRLEWLTLIAPRPGIAFIDGSDSGDAISAAHVGGFASALRAWLTASGGS
jgi:thioesterase domain-containing protein